MKDPTKAVRKMYVQGLSQVLTIYDGMAPATASGMYGVILNTSFLREATKSVNRYKFTVSLAIYQEFEEYGNSEGIDDTADAIIEIILPDDRSGYLDIDGYDQTEIIIESGGNTAFQNDASVIFQKTLTINHFITEN